MTVTDSPSMDERFRLHEKKPRVTLVVRLPILALLKRLHRGNSSSSRRELASSVIGNKILVPSLHRRRTGRHGCPDQPIVDAGTSALHSEA